MKSHIDIESFRVSEGVKVDLKEWPTDGRPIYEDSGEYRKMMRQLVVRLDRLQSLLYASNQYSVLLIFQAMDAAGKDGAVKHVMSGVNPQGCEVHSFKRPSAEELEHDFLWRTNRRLPERGRIGIFNRSYYEEVLVVRVHPELLKAQDLTPGEANDPHLWKRRYRSIRDLEEHLYRNGTRIIKFFLHLSKEEQRRRLLRRIDDPSRNWKFDAADVVERKHWKDYMSAYEDCLGATSTDHAPWYVVPADDKKNARLIISNVIVDTLKRLDMDYPTIDDKRMEQLQALRRQLVD